MPSADDLGAYEAALRQREQLVLERLRMNVDSSEPPSLDEEIGRLTRQDALQQQQMALHARRRLETQLARIRGAFDRLERGVFGACALCDGAIPHERLDLAHETPFCIPCQTRLEKDHGDT